ncbi:hypothetical protein [Prosthecobacter sp.]|uniref:hypothetical protein n=1 Tax=Prosthecobacter sp. TaxID=1965333 RepID=UPI00248913B8|nr:hypothetical protein [Prosthecobacter sp.]MDI1312397.1 hypothetical protein [Prosthecobacter sp.]
METLSVRCNHCGAPLQVSGSTRFVTCQFCHSSLEVKRTDTSIFTEEVAKIAQNTGKMAESLEVITLQNEIERLDRENAPEVAATQAKQLPAGAKVAGGLIGMIMMLLFTSFGLFFAISSSRMGAPFIFQLFGGGFALIGIIALVSIISKAVSSSTKIGEVSSYETRRAALVQKLAALAEK